MAMYDQDWCDALASAVGTTSTLADQGPLSMLFVVTDTEEGKVAFNLSDSGDELTVTSGKLPRGVKADITITVKEPVAITLWAGTRNRDEAFMAGDIKVEGAYARWLDEVVPAFAASPWVEAWTSSAS